MNIIKGKYIIILLICMLITGCSTKPSEEKIKSDIEERMGICSISYIPVQNYPILKDDVVEYNLALNSMEIEKSLTQDSMYTVWVKAVFKNDDITSTRYVNLEYKKYDGGKWELESISEYEKRMVEFSTESNKIVCNSIKSLFVEPIEIESVEVVEMTKDDNGNIEGIVKLIGVNHKGYYSYSTGQVYDEDVKFEVYIDVTYSMQNEIWEIGEINRNSSRTITPVSTDVVENILDDSLIYDFKNNRYNNLINSTNFSYTLMYDDYMDGQIIDYIEMPEGDDQVLFNSYDYENSARYYNEYGILDVFVNFNMPESVLAYGVSYTIWNRDGKFSMDDTFETDYFSNLSGIQEGYIHITYPYEGDLNTAYITGWSSYDTNKEHAYGKAYGVSFHNENLAIQIDNIQIPAMNNFLGDISWPLTYDTSIVIYPQKVVNISTNRGELNAVDF